MDVIVYMLTAYCLIVENSEEIMKFFETGKCVQYIQLLFRAIKKCLGKSSSERGYHRVMRGDKCLIIMTTLVRINLNIVYQS